MLTRCPRCLTVFQLLAEHLKVAHGQVQCGRCNLQFDALENLQDEAPQLSPADLEPATRASITGPPVAGVAVPAVALSRREMPEWAFAELPEPERNATSLRDAEDGEPESKPIPDLRVPDEERETQLSMDLDGEDSMRLENDARRTGPESAEDVLLADLPRIAIDRDEIEALRSYLAEGTAERSGSSAWWGAAAGVLLLALAAQLVWFERDLMFLHYPQTRDWWQQICTGRPCELTYLRDLDAVQVVARDVRDHPRYRNALLVNATLVNTAQFAQEFPVIELTLYDQAGRPIGSRRFAPEEYLDESIARDVGMRPQQPVYIVLELAGTGEQAVSFEFKFL